MAAQDEDQRLKAPMPRWLEPTGKYSEKKKRANANERRVMKELGGRRMPNSGARPWGRGGSETEGRDGETADLVVEHKGVQEGSKSMSVKREWLEQIAEVARRAQKDPALVLTFEGMQKAPKDWLVLPLDVARRLLGVEVK